MPDTTSAAADAVVAPTPAEGVTPVARMQEAKAALKASSKPVEELQAPDPLDESPEGEDPLLTHDQDLANADPLHREGEAEPEAEEETAEVEVPAEPEVVPVEEAAPEEEPEAETPHGRKRINIFRKDGAGKFVYSDRERAAMQFADEQGIGVIDAYARLFGDVPGAKPAEPAAKVDPPKPEPTVADIQAQLADLKAKRREATKNLELDKQSDLSEQIEDLMEAKAKAEMRAERGEQQKQTAQQKFDSEIQASGARAVAAFPDAAKEDSELSMALTRARMSKPPGFFEDPEWPETLVAAVAYKMGIAPAKAKIATPVKSEVKPAGATPPVKVPPKQAARPAPAPGGVSAPRANDTQDMQNRLAIARKSNDMEAAKAILREATLAAKRK